MPSVSIGKFFSCIGKPRILYKMALTPNTGQSKSFFCGISSKQKVWLSLNDLTYFIFILLELNLKVTRLDHLTDHHLFCSNLNVTFKFSSGLFMGSGLFWVDLVTTAGFLSHGKSEVAKAFGLIGRTLTWISYRSGFSFVFQKNVNIEFNPHLSWVERLSCRFADVLGNPHVDQSAVGWRAVHSFVRSKAKYSMILTEYLHFFKCRSWLEIRPRRIEVSVFAVFSLHTKDKLAEIFVQFFGFVCLQNFSCFSQKFNE